MKMAKKIEQSANAGDNSNVTQIAGNFSQQIVNIYTCSVDLIDQEINKQVDILRKSRFYDEFDRYEFAQTLGMQLNDNLKGGSSQVRSMGLAWCARVLSTSDQQDHQAENYLEVARTLEKSDAVRIAEAFIESKKNGKSSALKILADINTPAARSASLMIVSAHDNIDVALAWLQDAGYTTEQLDAEGKQFVLGCQIMLGRWNEAMQTVDSLTMDDFVETPRLHHLCALALLALAVPPEYRARAVAEIPVNTADFPLSSKTDALVFRTRALAFFLRAVIAAKQLNCPRAANISDEYALWLELRDPELYEHGKARLLDNLSDPSKGLFFVPLALQFELDVVSANVERTIEQTIAISGGTTPETLRARYALAYSHRTYEEVAKYLEQHVHELSTSDGSSLFKAQLIEILVRSGQCDRAETELETLIGVEDSEEMVNSLRRIISEARGNDPVEALKNQYRTTNALQGLFHLVNELVHRNRWEEVCEFGMMLFNQTNSIKDANRIVHALYVTKKSREIVEFLQANADLLPQSDELQMAYAWSLYYEGQLRESRAQLDTMGDVFSTQYRRSLFMNIAITSGDWNAITQFITHEHEHRSQRDSDELIEIARLALHLNLDQAKALVFTAAEKANNDPRVLASAYFMATSAGWESDPEVSKWFSRAMQLSGDDGPLQKISVNELLDQRSHWVQHEYETWSQLSKGEIPISIAAQSLNRALTEFTTSPALTNRSQSDLRRKRMIPAYSGKRESLEYELMGKSVTIDVTALLSLSLLDILDKVFESFGTIYIPHATMRWLFKEQQRALFHQPSRIKDAERIRNCISTQKLNLLVPKAVADSALAARVGSELATLLAEAEGSSLNDDQQWLVVRSGPVHRISSLMNEEVDLGKYAQVMSTCMAVVEKLRKKAVITRSEFDSAMSFLKSQERAWTNQPVIADGAVLLLDEIAVTHLLHLGMLEKIHSAGLSAFVSQGVSSEIDALISYNSVSYEVREVLDRIRQALFQGIQSGKVKIGRFKYEGHSDENSLAETPTLNVMTAITECDFLLVDDRFMNKHRSIDVGEKHVSTLTTLDILDVLMNAGKIDTGDLREYRSKLRLAGYYFIPVGIDELEQCLRDSPIVDGVLQENTELRAIRESILRIRMSDVLQLPEEAAWFSGFLGTFTQVLKNQWVNNANIEEVRIRSNWLLEQLDIRGWAHVYTDENAEYIVRIGRSEIIMSILLPPTGVDSGILREFWKWAEERVLLPIQEQFPDLFQELVRKYEVLLDNVLNDNEDVR